MGRLRRLDGMRGILAVYVMLGHALPLTIAPGFVQSLFRHGEAAVDLFFALSGLVIAASLERFGGAFRPFIMARARRLLPVYFIVLAAAIAIADLGDPLRTLPWVSLPARDLVAAALPRPFWPHLLAHLTLLHGLIPQAALPYAYITLLGPAWSLSTEWQFYVLIGLIVPRHLGRFALAVLALGAAWHLLPYGGAFSRAFFPDAAPYFALGLASAAWLRGQRATLLPCLIGACAIGLLTSPEKALPPLAWGAILLANSRPWGAILEHRAVLYLGAISYPLYLVNAPVERAVTLLLGPLTHGSAAVFSAIFLPLTLSLSLVIAALLHYGVERRFMRPGREQGIKSHLLSLPRL
ncbi:acyltransferase [Acidocella sp.]|uniref:acyltransferase family protein n=1 Tax=Acidocella sp. TaxID=50710 RepID=UPI002620A387|nr:acyltransferase [Acidocella sp.]